MKEAHLKISDVIMGGIVIMFAHSFPQSTIAGFIVLPMVMLAALLLFGFPRGGGPAVPPEDRLAICLFATLLEGVVLPFLTHVTGEMPMLRGILLLIWLFIGLMILLNLLIGDSEVVGYSIRTGKGSYLHFKFKDDK